jgi:hypothetical protein
MRPYLPSIDRRTAIQWVIAASTLPGLSRRAAARANTVVAHTPAPAGYGTDPNLLHPVTPWPRTMTQHQLQLTAMLADLILPGTAATPAPSALGIPDFVDEWISAPYPEQNSDRSIISGGLAWLDDESRRRWQCGFLDLDDENRREIVRMIAAKPRSSAVTAEYTFLRRLRFLVVGAYYTTPEGFRDIGYVGNIAMASYPPPTRQEMTFLDEELRKLGLANAWRSLLEEKTANAWHGWASPGLPKGWHVDNGVLSKRGEVDDLITHQKFGNFELELEWKIGKGGNSGIFYRGTHQYNHIYWSAPEYQLLDDANAEDGRNRLTAAGAAYGLYAAPADVVLPFGHWNTTRLAVHGPHVEHWLNGHKLVEYELWSVEWKAKVAASKFAQYPYYGMAKNGVIGIQGDHDGALELRHIRIHELP